MQAALLALVCLVASAHAAPVREENDVRAVLSSDLDAYDIDKPLGDWIEARRAAHPRQLLTTSNVIPVASSERERENGGWITAAGSAPKQVAVQPPPSPPRSSEDKVNSIAFNSKEVRLVNGKEVEMKDDVATRLMVAMDNLSKEATEVWGQVNTKLDKGWTELKTMIETAIKKQQQPWSSSSSNGATLVTKRSSDEYAFIGDDDNNKSPVESSAASVAENINQAASQAADKVKDLFSDSNRQKASEALSTAGESIKETVTKDIPDALQKAGSAVSDFAKKNLPSSLSEAFGR